MKLYISTCNRYNRLIIYTINLLILIKKTIRTVLSRRLQWRYLLQTWYNSFTVIVTLPSPVAAPATRSDEIDYNVSDTTSSSSPSQASACSPAKQSVSVYVTVLIHPPVQRHAPLSYISIDSTYYIRTIQSSSLVWQVDCCLIHSMYPSHTKCWLLFTPHRIFFSPNYSSVDGHVRQENDWWLQYDDDEDDDNDADEAKMM